MGIEYADRFRRSEDIVTSLARAAGMDTQDLIDDIYAGGRDLAFRRAAQKAEQRKAQQGKGDPRQRLVELLRRRG